MPSALSAPQSSSSAASRSVTISSRVYPSRAARSSSFRTSRAPVRAMVVARTARTIADAASRHSFGRLVIKCVPRSFETDDMMGASALSRISAIDNAVPAQVIGELRAQIIESQARRPEPSDGGTSWYGLDAPARVLFEQVIQHLRSFVPGGNEFIGAEWWCRATTTDAGFPFHFDRDEGIRSSIVSPGLATILYLSNAGGPTVILDATPSRIAAPKAGIAVYPRPGRFGMFPGTLLHGVLPGRPGRWPRVTMLVNWWRSVPRLERAPEQLASTPASSRWRFDVDRIKTPFAALESFDPSRLLAKAAWRDIISKQTTFR